MSWESMQARELISVPHTHKLSATHLLASPDGSRHPLDNLTTDICDFDNGYSRLAASFGSIPIDNGHATRKHNRNNRGDNDDDDEDDCDDDDDEDGDDDDDVEDDDDDDDDNDEDGFNLSGGHRHHRNGIIRNGDRMGGGGGAGTNTTSTRSNKKTKSFWHRNGKHGKKRGNASGSGGGGGSRNIGCAGNVRRRYAFLECFFTCQKSIKQYIAKKKIERGLRLYEQHNQSAAVRTWRSALKSTSRRNDRFRLLGYLYRAHIDWGKYREALEFCHRQLFISEELDAPNMRAEAYLNLARAHERLGGLERALSYARHSLYNECGTQCRTGGLVHLTVARVYLEMGGFSRALEGLQGAHKIANAIGDSSLELQVYVSLSELFGRLQDCEKSANYASKAYDLSRSLQVGDLNSSDHRAALLRMASSLRKQGELGDAHDYCTEATRLALISSDQATYTRSIRIMGDIYRKKLDIDRAFRQYEQAMGTAAELGDRMAQMEAMDGAARCLELLRVQQKICNCRPLEFNTRLLEVAGSIGAKLLVRKIRSRLALIYRALGDEEQFKQHTRMAHQMEIQLGLYCGVCEELFGLDSDSLEALPCSHILHSRCAHEIYRRREKTGSRACPTCTKLANSRNHVCGGGGVGGGGSNGGSGGSGTGVISTSANGTLTIIGGIGGGVTNGNLNDGLFNHNHNHNKYHTMTSASANTTSNHCPITSILSTSNKTIGGAGGGGGSSNTLSTTALISTIDSNPHLMKMTSNQSSRSKTMESASSRNSQQQQQQHQYNHNHNHNHHHHQHSHHQNSHGRHQQQHQSGQQQTHCNNNNNNSNLSLASLSLRASSLTIDSECNITSSV